ncbi:MAG: hypothetical protein RBT71_05545 [Flavobacteriales bacterium]|jgi:uncharacterized protein HemX|nr:hypothetical protein [Flavobacteriales bacterium]
MRTPATLLLLTAATGAFAQAAPSWVEDGLYGGGKMNAVVAVVAVILLGMGLWLWRQDRRIARMERRIDQNPQRDP